MLEALMAVGAFGFTLWAVFDSESGNGGSGRTSTLAMKPLDYCTPRSLGNPRTRAERTVI